MINFDNINKNCRIFQSILEIKFTKIFDFSRLDAAYEILKIDAQ